MLPSTCLSVDGVFAPPFRWGHSPDEGEVKINGPVEMNSVAADEGDPSAPISSNLEPPIQRLAFSAH
ncbi:uncharacterized protein ColSpa_06561 [Colletotrichum spaethianum]|uniref:Uncharacterized protein n=1 Tax=Colletotrichum spaethianum TaxID=700344 RepID=A0AA37LH11_9PEZI|nr:uncharacterized protein ColSpa_06561 [Colletotrichum spaethianum]GKT46380.1 hypothetical protein ColSpa_06561 [Colletotrichum spaethianum]